MAKGSTIAKIVAALVLAAVLIATLALTIVVLVKVQNQNNSNSKDTATTAAPISAAPTSAVPTTFVPSSVQPTTGLPTSEATLYPYVYTYEGQFTDRKSTWDIYLSSASSREFRKAQQEYRQEIQEVVDKGFNDTYVYVAYFTNDANRIRIYFTITVSNATNPRAPSAKAFQIEIENRSIKENKDWAMMVVTNMGQNTLPPVSTSQGWKDAAEMFLNAIDTSIDPCDDFYAFSCNKFLQDHPLNNTDEVSYFSMLDDNIVSQMQDLLTNYSLDTTTGPKSLRTAALFYSSCINSQSMQYEGAKRLLEILSSFGGWPLITPDWKRPTTKYSDISYLMAILTNSYGVATFLTPGVDIDWRNVSRHRMSIAQATLTVPASLYRTPGFEQEILDELALAIYQTGHALANITHASIDEEQFQADVMAMTQLEFNLAMISVLPDDERNQSNLYNPYTTFEAQQKWTQINWATYLYTLSLNHSVDPQTLETFIIEEPSYQTALTDLLLTNYSSPEGMRTVYNYLIWRFVSQYSKFGGPEFLKLTAELRRRSKPQKDSLPPPETDCAEQVRDQLPWAIGRMYVDKYFSDSERVKAGIMTSVILAAFRGQLSGLQWMDDVSKMLSLRKVYYLVKNVGYPDFIKNDTQLDNYHAWINGRVNGDTNYMDFTLDLVYFEWDNELKLLSMVPDRTEFLDSPTTVNAWYQPERNSITLPAAILNPPFYRPDFPMAVNYGGIGAVMGHELTHGFDDQGVQYDYNGTLNTWMGAASEIGFNKMSNCAVQQYNGYCYDLRNRTLCLNGATTQGENIADNGGIKAAYQAYKAYVASNGEEPRLPGMESFTMDQLFFLSYGNIWCTTQADRVLVSQIITNPHSPAQSRVNGTLQNFEPFAAAFGCRRGDRMFPPQHCDIW